MNSPERNLPEAPDGAAVKLRQAILAVVEREGSRAELESAARELVGELRREDHPPEQVLLRIKEILAEAGLRPGHTLASNGSEVMSEAALYRELISSSIRYYFDGDGRAPNGGS